MCMKDSARERKSACSVSTLLLEMVIVLSCWGICSWMRFSIFHANGMEAVYHEYAESFCFLNIDISSSSLGQSNDLQLIMRAGARL
jgi:hypothetical protein